MTARGRALLGFFLALATACGGASSGMGVFAGDRDPDELPYEPTPPPPAPLAVADWSAGGSGAKPEAVVAHTDPGDLPRLKLASEAAPELPLEHTHVKARLTGFVAEVEVTQTYKNPHGEPIEAVYIFPLPENSAVHAMRMQIGERVIEAKIHERGQARRIYTDAKRKGYTAALLEQERPNVFTQSVANIEPGKKIDVVIRYVQDLSYDAGEYEFVFPMVVGPRFNPGAPLEGPQSGSGTHADTSQVPDASRISPPIVGNGKRSGHDISLELEADASLAVGDFEVPTHQVVSRRPADGSLHLTLAEKDSLPNRDFVLRYRVTGEKPKATLYAAGGFFSLVVHPPSLDVERLVGQREIIFVVDVSGSMSGTPLGLCQSAMREAISQLRPVDTFNVLTFSGATQKAFERPRPANRSNISQAMAVIDEMQAGGGTYMADAIDAALSPDVERGRHRYVFFMTDGYVGNEDEIIGSSQRFVEAMEGRGQRARVFGFGVGSSVNRYLLEGLSRAGKGIAVYATNREDPHVGVNRFYHYIDRAVLTDVQLAWNGLGASDVFPNPLPDLFASHPIVLHGRYEGRLKPTGEIRARTGDREITIPVSVRPVKTEQKAQNVLGSLWARSKIADLEELLWEGNDPAAQQQITQLGIEHHLVTRFTSFVAVDTSRRVSRGDPRKVVQPVEAPEGVDVEMAGGVRQEASRQQVAGATFEDEDGMPMEEEMGAYEEPADAPPSPEPMAGSDSTELYAVEDRRGCGCRAAGSEGVPRPSWLAVLAIGMACAARRHRRRGRS